MPALYETAPGVLEDKAGGKWRYDVGPATCAGCGWSIDVAEGCVAEVERDYLAYYHDGCVTIHTDDEGAL